jgi:dTDP-glucose 4,6-dehydratase
MKVLVIGCNGFLGSALSKELECRGHEVYGADISHRHDEHSFSIKTNQATSTYFRCDISQYRQVERVIEYLHPVDYVYNFAAEFGRWNGEDYFENLWKTNVIGLKNLLNVQHLHPFKLIFLSSSEIYGDWDGLITEDVTSKHAIRQLNDYAITKWVGEVQIQNAIDQLGSQTVIFRPFNIYGPGERFSPYRSVNVRFAYYGLNGIPFTVYKGYIRTFTYLDNAIHTLAEVLTNFRNGEAYNLADSTGYTIEELAQVVLDETGADESLVTYKENDPATSRSKIVSNEKIVTDFGHTETIDLAEGMRRMIGWLKNDQEITKRNR